VLTRDVALAGEYQVNAGGELYPAAVSLRPPFDPAGDRIKGRYRVLPRLFGQVHAGQWSWLDRTHS
jgi:hypothetical protein